MQNLLWKAILKNGQIIQQQKDGNYFDFTKLDKKDLICFTVCNKNNNSVYTINLMTGQFLINGIPISPTLQQGGEDIDCICYKKLNYAYGLFWYNYMTSQLDLLGKTATMQLENTYFGYQVQIQYPFVLNGIQGKIIKARPMLKIQRSNNRVTFSIEFTFQYFKNGQKQNLRF